MTAAPNSRLREVGLLNRIRFLGVQKLLMRTLSGIPSHS